MPHCLNGEAIFLCSWTNGLHHDNVAGETAVRGGGGRGREGGREGGRERGREGGEEGGEEGEEEGGLITDGGNSRLTSPPSCFHFSLDSRSIILHMQARKHVCT